MKRLIVVPLVLASLVPGAAAAFPGSPGLRTSPSASPGYFLKFAGSLRESDGTPGSTVFYLVAGRNTTCGEEPKR
jgi:hypothetical protein